MSTADETSVHSRILDCSIAAFKHLIQRVMNRYPYGWPSTDGTVLRIDVLSCTDEFPTILLTTRRSDRQSSGGVAYLSTEPAGRGTAVEVHDGDKPANLSYKVTADGPIGSPLEEFVRVLAEEVTNPVAPLVSEIPPGLEHVLGYEASGYNIHSELFDGDKQDFRRLMRRLRNRHPRGWKPQRTVPDGTRLVFGPKIATRYPEYWVEFRISLRRTIRPKPAAVIEVVDRRGEVRIRFTDRMDIRERPVKSEMIVHCAPLGELFEEFCKYIVDEIRDPVVPLQAFTEPGYWSPYARAFFGKIIHRVDSENNLLSGDWDLRTTMRNFLQYWLASDGTRLQVAKGPLASYGTVYQLPLQPARPVGEATHQCACLAIERVSRDRYVWSFLDGVDPRSYIREKVEPIGLAFEEFTRDFVREAGSDSLPPFKLHCYLPLPPEVEPPPASLYRGDLDSFVQLMDSFTGANSAGWLSTYGTRLQLTRGPRSTEADGPWAIYDIEAVAGPERRHTGHCATLRAREEDEMTLVVFRDCDRSDSSAGETEEPRSIGEPLKELRRKIIALMALSSQRGANIDHEGLGRFSEPAKYEERRAEGTEVDSTDAPQAAATDGNDGRATIADKIVPDELRPPGKYGSSRDLTAEDVKSIVERCREYQRNEGSVRAFYEQLAMSPADKNFFELETLRGWLKNPRFAPEGI